MLEICLKRSKEICNRKYITIKNKLIDVKFLMQFNNNHVSHAKSYNSDMLSVYKLIGFCICLNQRRLLLLTY